MTSKLVLPGFLLLVLLLAALATGGLSDFLHRKQGQPDSHSASTSSRVTTETSIKGIQRAMQGYVDAAELATEMQALRLIHDDDFAYALDNIVEVAWDFAKGNCGNNLGLNQDGKEQAAYQMGCSLAHLANLLRAENPTGWMMTPKGKLLKGMSRLISKLMGSCDPKRLRRGQRSLAEEVLRGFKECSEKPQ